MRGSLSITQTGFANTTFENDDEIAGTLEAELALGGAAVLRLGYTANRSWTGDDLSIGGLVVPVRSDEFAARICCRARRGGLRAAGDGRRGCGLGSAGRNDPGRLRSAAGAAVAGGRFGSGAGGMGAGVVASVAVLAAMEAWFTQSPKTNRSMFLRAPADGGRAAAGLRLGRGYRGYRGGRRAGYGLAKGGAELASGVAVFCGECQFDAIAEVTVTLGAESGIELADPVDSVAGRTVAIEAGAAWSLRPDVTLFGQAGWMAGSGAVRSWPRAIAPYGDVGGHLSASEHSVYGATVSWSRHDDPAESYDKTGIALSLSGTL